MKYEPWANLRRAPNIFKLSSPFFCLSFAFLLPFSVSCCSRSSVFCLFDCNDLQRCRSRDRMRLNAIDIQPPEPRLGCVIVDPKMI